MRSIKRDLIGLTAICALVLAFALAWGGPSGATGVALAQAQPQQQPQQQPDQAQPQPSQGQASTASTFTGTVVKNGDQYMLRDSSGQVFGLDDSDKAKQFEGKAVKVTGQLDEQAKVIHVQDIQASEG
jgi:uncharacterized protein YdeI (BOF family)